MWILAASALLILLRSPLLLLHGRVVAEEGTVYLQEAWLARPLDILLAVHQGYYSLLMNLLTMLNAKVVPLEWVGQVLTFSAAAILLLTVFLAVECETFVDPLSRAMAAGICLLTPSIEVWMTAEDCQFVLALAVALICLSDARRHKLMRGGTLLLAAMSGPVSCVFTPMFLFRAWRERNVWRSLQAFVMLVCSAIQGSILLASVRTGGRNVTSLGKEAWFGPVLVLKIFAVEFFSRLGAFAAQRLAVPHPTPIVCLFFWIVFFGFMAIFVCMARAGGEAGWLCLSMALASLGFNYQGISDSRNIILIGAFRYFFTGSALFGLVLVVALARSTAAGQSRSRRLALLLASITLATGAIDAVGYWSRFQVCKPYWRTEVARWRQSGTPLAVHPPDWGRTIHLSKK